MIVTVTPNPGLDLTYTLAPGDALTRDDIEVHRAASVSIEASGKGVNVTRTLAGAGVASLAVLGVGGATGAQLVQLLDRDGVRHSAVTTAGATRVNTTVLAPGGPTTKLNGPGAAFSDAEQDALVAATAQALAAGATWLAVCGSLPPGADGGLVTRLIEVARAAGVRCAVDSSGEALAAALHTGADLFSPNARELAAVSPAVAAALEGGLEALAEAAAGFAADHGCELLVSLGADGAIWTDGTVALHARGQAAVPVNTAGAGDALMSGWLAGGSDPSSRLVRAVIWGRAACLSPTTVMNPGDLDPDDGPAVEVSETARGVRRSAADPTGQPPTSATAHA